MHRLVALLAAAVVAATVAAAASAGQPQVQAKWRLAVASWTKQAGARGLRAQCGPVFAIYPRCAFVSADASRTSSVIRASAASSCVWAIQVYRSPGSSTKSSTVSVNICKAGWLRRLPHPS